MDATACLVPDCGRIADASRGWCRKHYSRWRRWGDPMAVKRLGPADLAQTTHCVNGHAWTLENTYVRLDSGTRQCKACSLDKKRAAAAARPRRPARPPAPPKINVCAAPGCERTLQGFRVCSMHRTRMLKTGSYDPPIRPTAAERFWAKIAPAEALACWEWTGSKVGGYGRFGDTKRGGMPAYRWAYEFLIGPIPAGLVLDHLCRNAGCVNPYHLDPVTGSENSRRATQPRVHCACCPRRGELIT